MDASKLVEVYATDGVDITKKELEWVIDNVEALPTPSKFAYNEYTFTNEQGSGMDCSCSKELDEREYDKIKVTMFHVTLDGTITDVPREEWEYDNGRVLRVWLCSRCEGWSLTD